jgi:hypothetical protein
MPVATPIAVSFLQIAPPPELQWLALILSLLSLPALYLALPPYLDWKYGDPRILLSFDDRDLAGTHVLECRVFNPPIAHPVLRWFGIRRKEAEITAGVLIRQHGSNRYITETVPIIRLMGGGPARTQRVILRESAEPALIAIAAHEDGQAIFDPLGEKTPLKPGEYWADVNVDCGAQRAEASRAFVVQPDGELFWRGESGERATPSRSGE